MNSYLKFTFLFIALIFFNLPIKAQFASKADSVIKHNLNIIEKFIKDYGSDTSLRRTYAISLLEGVTGIASESDGDFGGKHTPTRRDFDLWSSWYLGNKTNIFWDELQQAIIVRKLIKVFP